MKQSEIEKLKKLIDVGKDAQEICKSLKISMATLRRKHSELVFRERTFIDIPGLYVEQPEVILEKGSLTLSKETLQSLGASFNEGAKFKVKYFKNRNRVSLTLSE